MKNLAHQHDSTKQHIDGLSRIKRLLSLYRRRFRTRNDIKSLSPEILEDIGLNEYQANHEADKPFWRS